MTGPHTEFQSTDFAITSVNVPDRLDLREVDDRKQQDEASFYAKRRSALRIWGRRLLPYAILAAVLLLASSWFAEERETLGAARISQRLSAGLHIAVRVQDTRFRTTPSPAIVLSGVDLGGQVRLEEVAVEFTAPSLWQAVMSGQRRWGDIVISPTSLSFDQASQLMTWLASVDHLVPDSVTRVRFAQIHFPGSGLLPDRYEAVARRESNGQFNTVTLRRLDSPGSMQLLLTPDRSGGPVAFQCDAADWQPPFTPRTPWSEVVASGHISAGAIDVDKFTLGSAFGAMEGQLLVRRQEHSVPPWTASGQLSSVGIDVATVIQQVAGPSAKGPAGAAPAAEPTPPMAGTAAIDAVLSGAGVTPEDALSRLIAGGEIKVRSASLNGINLGYAASRPSAHASGTGASTRFTQLETSFLAGENGVVFRKIHGLAGALSARGELAVTPSLALDGLLHVDLGGARIQAPLRVHVRGTLTHPEFGR
jgi:hypothetical protein